MTAEACPAAPALSLRRVLAGLDGDAQVVVSYSQGRRAEIGQRQQGTGSCASRRPAVPGRAGC